MSDSVVDPVFAKLISPTEKDRTDTLMALLGVINSTLTETYGPDVAFSMVMSRHDRTGDDIGSSYVITNTTPIGELPYILVLTNDEQIKPVVEAIEKITTGDKVPNRFSVGVN